MNRRRKVFTALSLGLAIAPAAALIALGGPAGAQGGAAELFQKKCNTCHRPDAPAATKGPSLNGMAGASVAAQSDYAYSDGLKAKSGQRWTDANLDAYLTDPRAWAPGTKMLPKVADAGERAQIIQHLKTLK
jgi:cytochrome c